MTTTRHDTADGTEDGRTPAFGAADCLSLAAAPTFAAMAVLATVLDGNAPPLCGAAHDVLALSGMTLMYMLMSAFHLVPWLRLISGWRASAGRPFGQVAAR
jgi:hypothetical protein